MKREKRKTMKQKKAEFGTESKWRRVRAEKLRKQKGRDLNQELNQTEDGKQ